MRSIHLYDPKIYSIILTRLGPSKEKELLALVKEEVRVVKDIKVDISFKSEWAVIELHKNTGQSDKEFSEISPELIKMGYDNLTYFSSKLKEKLKPLTSDGCEPHIYNLISTGTKDHAWMKTYSDMTFLFKDKKSDRSEILQTNISYLNRIMNGRGEVSVNSMKHGDVGVTLYVLGKMVQEKDSLFPKNMLLEINISDIRSKGIYGESPVSVSNPSPYGDVGPSEKKIYQTKQNYLINLLGIKSKLVEFFLVQSQFLDMKNNEMTNVKNNGQMLKDEIYSLQNNINEHMKLYIPKEGKKKRKKERDFLEREYFEKEKELLTSASVRFTLVSEVEHQIMRQTSILQDMDLKTHEIIRSLDIKAEEISVHGMIYSLGEITFREMESNKRELSHLMEELSHSRDILSSTIEVLRTFIDTRQREVSEDLSRLMNLLFLVFALIGLADAIGNFVILVVDKGYLSGNPALGDVYYFGMIGILVTLVPLLIAAIFLYLYFKKRK